MKSLAVALAGAGKERERVVARVVDWVVLEGRGWGHVW